MPIKPSGYHAPITEGQLGAVATSFLFAGIGFGRLFSGAVESEGRFAGTAAIVILLLLVAAFAYRRASRAIPAPTASTGQIPRMLPTSPSGRLSASARSGIRERAA
jgi:hypothetical protein